MISLLDIFIIIFFIILFFIVSNKYNKLRPNTNEDYILMGRSLTLPLFVATLTSTWYGGIFGVTQIAFNSGVYNFFTQGLFWYFSYAVFAIFLVKKIRKHNILSLPELLGIKFGDKARSTSAVLIFFHALPVTYALSSGILLHMLFNISVFTGLVICVLLVSSYSFLGGFRGVVFSDALQFVLMFSSQIILVGFLIFNFGLHPFLVNNLPESHFNWFGQTDMSSALIWLFIACTSTLTHPAFYQRCMAAKSDRVAILGIFIAMGFWLVFDICTTLLGMYARAILPTADSYKACLILGLQVLPVGLKGFYVVGIISTIFSTMDSFLFVSGTSISYDLLKKHKHQWSIFLSAGMLIILASYFDTNFEAIWLFLEGLFSSAVFLPVILALFYKKPLSPVCFFGPSLCAVLLFCWATFTNLTYIQPFYLAHIGAFLVFIVSLNTHANRQAKITLSPNS